jgi:hypothetical protein
MTRADLIANIEAFAQRHGIAPATVTSRAVANSRLYRRMKDGGSCSLTIAERLVTYMAAQEATPTPEEDAA